VNLIVLNAYFCGLVVPLALFAALQAMEIIVLQRSVCPFRRCLIIDWNIEEASVVRMLTAVWRCSFMFIVTA
jgi:hypothetical protein